MTEPCDCDLPDDFRIEAADHMERVETTDGEPYRVLVDFRTDERHLVHESVVDYEGRDDHPATEGAAAFVGLLAVLAVPLAGGYAFASLTGLDAYVIGVVSTGLAVYNFNHLLSTTLGDWLWRFAEWNEVKHLVAGGEAA